MKLSSTFLIVAVTLLFTRAWADAGHAHHHSDTTFGRAGDPRHVSRTIEIDMSDTMRFTPSSIAAKKGETIRFVVKNSGKLKHEMVIGTDKQLREHAAVMKKFPEMEHDDPNHVVVDPGKSGELVWQFTKSGTVGFACLQPGHFEAGMRGSIAVR